MKTSKRTDSIFKSTKDLGFGVTYMDLLLCSMEFIRGAGSLTYFRVYLTDMGMSISTIGVLFMTTNFTTMFTPVIGMLVDLTGRMMHVTQIWILTVVGGCLWMWMQPRAILTDDLDSSWQLYIFCPIITLMLSATRPLMDVVFLTVGSKSRYSLYKSTFTVGRTVVSVAVGALTTARNFYPEYTSLHLTWPVAAGCWFIFFILTSILSCRETFPQKEKSKEERGGFCKSVGTWLCGLSRGSWLILLNFLVLGIAKGTIQSYFYIFVGQIGGSPLLMSLTQTLTVIGEVPAFLLFKPAVRRFGCWGILGFGGIAYSLRMVWYAMLYPAIVPCLENPNWVLLLELFHGFTYAWIYCTAAIFGYILSPPELRTTGTAVFSMVYVSMGNTFGALIGGYLYDSYGSQVMWIAIATSCVPFIIYNLASRASQSSKMSRLLDEFLQYQDDKEKDKSAAARNASGGHVEETEMQRLVADDSNSDGLA